MRTLALEWTDLTSTTGRLGGGAIFSRVQTSTALLPAGCTVIEGSCQSSAAARGPTIGDAITIVFQSSRFIDGELSASALAAASSFLFGTTTDLHGTASATRLVAA